MRTRGHRARPGTPAPAVAVVVLIAAVLTACTRGDVRPRAESAAPRLDGGAGGAAPAEPPATLAVDSRRGGDAVVAAGGADAVYNYGPSVLVDGGTTRMWWCSQYGSAAPAGDDILYAEADSPDGPFTGPTGGIPPAVLSGNPGAFDAVHTCDPSVLRVGGTYYMYYTGAAGETALGNAIGLATSTDGLHWHRPTTGPVVTPAHDTRRGNTYGAGQPAAVYLDGWFYLMFTDTTARAAGWNGAGQFLLRSRDPAFTDGVQALGPRGFEPVPDTGSPRTISLVDAFSADLVWVDALEAFAIAHQTADGTTLTFWDRDFARRPYRPVVIPSRWEEGPGLVRQPDGHAPVSTVDVCGRVPFDVVQATRLGTAGAPTDLRHYGIDVHGIDGCGETDRALAVLDGIALPSPVRTMDLVVGGTVLRVDRRSVASALARRVLDRRPRALDTVGAAARLRAGAPVVRAGGRGTAFVLDGTLWPVTSAEAVRRNDSPVRPVSRAEWASYPVGPSLDYRASSVP